MATKIICDGCDREITGTVSPKIEVVLSGDRVAVRPTRHVFDLCDECRGHMEHQIDAAEWPRRVLPSCREGV